MKILIPSKLQFEIPAVYATVKFIKGISPPPPPFYGMYDLAFLQGRVCVLDFKWEAKTHNPLPCDIFSFVLDITYWLAIIFKIHASVIAPSFHRVVLYKQKGNKFFITMTNSCFFKKNPKAVHSNCKSFIEKQDFFKKKWSKK